MAKEKKGKIITITSMKGGVGKSSTVILLASIYKELKKKVLLVDLDLYSGSIAFLLNANVKNIFRMRLVRQRLPKTPGWLRPPAMNMVNQPIIG